MTKETRWVKRLGIIVLYFLAFYWFFVLVSEWGYRKGFDDGSHALEKFVDPAPCSEWNPRG